MGAALLNDPEFSFLGATNEERKKAIFGCPSDDVTCSGGGGLKVYDNSMGFILSGERVTRTMLARMRFLAGSLSIPAGSSRSRLMGRV